jgi:hypothetical protein
MKLTKQQLKQIIKEELEKGLSEMGYGEEDPTLHSSAEQILTQLQELGYDSPEEQRGVLEKALASLGGESETWAWEPPHALPQQEHKK